MVLVSLMNRVNDPLVPLHQYCPPKRYTRRSDTRLATMKIPTEMEEEVLLPVGAAVDSGPMRDHHFCGGTHSSNYKRFFGYEDVTNVHGMYGRDTRIVYRNRWIPSACPTMDQEVAVDLGRRLSITCLYSEDEKYRYVSIYLGVVHNMIPRPRSGIRKWQVPTANMLHCQTSPTVS
jgi:hypothetical protein